MTTNEKKALAYGFILGFGLFAAIMNHTVGDYWTISECINTK